MTMTEYNAWDIWQCAYRPWRASDRQLVLTGYLSNRTAETHQRPNFDEMRGVCKLARNSSPICGRRSISSGAAGSPRSKNDVPQPKVRQSGSYSSITMAVWFGESREASGPIAQPKCNPQTKANARCQKHLTQPFEIIGAPREIRTPDPLITNQMLYQLSYRGTGWQILPWPSWRKDYWRRADFSFCRPSGWCAPKVPRRSGRRR